MQHTCGAEAHDGAAGHVLAAVVADALDHGVRHAVAHRKALAAAAIDKQPPAGCAVQAGVAHQAGLRRLQRIIINGEYANRMGDWI